MLSAIDPVSLHVLISQFRPSDVLPSFLRFYFQVRAFSIDLIHDTRHLCMRSRIDGIKAVSFGISGGKQVIKSANTSNRGRVFFYSIKTRRRFHSHAKCTYQVLARFKSSLPARRTSTVATAHKRVTIISSTHDFDIIVFKMRMSSFPVV